MLLDDIPWIFFQAKQLLNKTLPFPEMMTYEITRRDDIKLIATHN